MAIPSAIQSLERIAGEGNAEAQFLLGEIYSAGEGVKRNKKKSRKWMTLAAEQGSAKAQYCLAAALFFEDNNREEAKEWARKSADKGEPRGAFLLAHIYDGGLFLGTSCYDYPKAFDLYRKAADLGSSLGRYKVAWWYQNALPPCCADRKRAIRMYKEIAEERIDAIKEIRRGETKEEGQSGEKAGNKRGTSWMLKYDIIERSSAVFAVDQLRKMAKEEDVDAQTALGELFLKGPDKYHEEAVFWLRRAALAWNAKAAFLMAQCYLTGDCVDTDMIMAKVLYEYAALNGIEDAKRMLCMFFPEEYTPDHWD